MPLPPPHPREVIHTREIVCCGLGRADGLWDIEARMVDRTSYPLCDDYRSVEGGAPFHDLAPRITVDNSRQIHSVEACIASATDRYLPCAECERRSRCEILATLPSFVM
jgi:hypothetical protein